MKLLHALVISLHTILLNSVSDAFTIPGRYVPLTYNVLKSSQYSSNVGGPTPNDEVIREEYSKWLQRYTKGDFDPERYENFKANFVAVTARNTMEKNRAKQNGETAPSPIQLNEFGDCSAGEYRQAMNQQQQQRQQQNYNYNRNSMGGPIRANSNNINSNSVSNPIINTRKNNGVTREALSGSTSQLRSVVEERRSLEIELAQLKQQLAEKKKLLQNTAKEEQDCQERLALREEQKRLLNDRLTNGWEDESNNNNGMM